MDQPSPPVYQDTSAPVTHSESELPAYTRRPIPPTRRELTEHVFELKNLKNRAWGTLKILSSAPSAKQVPTFLEGDDIAGSFTFNLEHSDHIREVRLMPRTSDILIYDVVFNDHDNDLVKGQVNTGTRPVDTFTFLDHSSTLWSKAMGDPSNPSTPSSSVSRYSGKLFGVYHWPFSFTLPQEVILPDVNGTGNARQAFRLPQTFLERLTQPSIHYELIVHIIRSKFRVDTKLQTTLAYVPAIKPDPPSLLRQLAYQENSPLLGPEADPEGWNSLPLIVIRGTIFSARSVEASCTLSLAKPLCYTRGTTIPLILTIKSQDSQALDLLSSPRAIAIRLRRRVRFHAAAGMKTVNNKQDNLWKDAAEDIGAAAWWPSTEGGSVEPNRRRLDGEINLVKTLVPSLAIGHLSIEYSVAVLPFEAIAFASADSGSLMEHRVEIATMFARGPRARTYAPPEYQNEQRIPDNYLIPPSRGFV